MRKGIFLIACLSGFLATALGAFGSHGLKTVASDEMIKIFELAVTYHFYHTFALLATALAGHWLSSRLLDFSAYAFICGIVLFSGSLYTYVLTGTKVFALITPLGGMCFLVGWLLLAATVWNHRNENVFKK
ncbi:DUF423 domain-containing protein [Parashewanella spongiae]|uniref:DUF423 domain-containing protein n=1 Tax=Parashewanella spongiae TaxID=342950 RepID=A0A3A6TNB5_9GAMM|nr:DUF423 domain-containing protein [Parashewanella spongiae]MCL1078791.1 DUF423 domain-containing protein [Parashewanella spongiae]RJY12207.1 DUF423 domain-containing protein [Parashewanella spongiae]